VNGLVAKEIRALLPLWLGCMALVGAMALVSFRAVEPFALIVVVGGSCALGALSLGHEYTGGTLTSMLAQPVSRARVLGVKTAVLAVMVATLLVFVFTVLFSMTAPKAGVAAVALLCGLCLVPWLTIVTRNPLAGAVFGISLLGMIWVLLNLFTPHHFAVGTFWRIATLLGVAAVALTWREFMRLEAIDGRGPHVHMAWSEASAVTRVRHATWAVIRKELGLHQIAFALAAIYFISAFRVVGHVSDAARDVFGGLTVLYSGVLALLIGSIASAEERQLGTLEWHQLLPMAAWKQWVLKAGTAIGLSLVLGIAVPALILLTTSGTIRFGGWYVAGVVLLTAIGLYVSSLSSSSLRALLLSSAVPLVLIMAMAALRIAFSEWSASPVNVALLVALVALLVGLAFDNHRDSERSLRRVSVQLFILLGCFALQLAVSGLVFYR
jgi:hypothetical protein